MAVFALLERLAPHIEEEVNLVINSKEEANTLSSRLKKIQIGLQDAERKSVTDQNVRDWLKDLEDVVYEMEDVLDEWEVINLELQFEENGSNYNPWDKVRSSVLFLCSCFHHVLERRELVLRMKALSLRLDKILDEKGKYDFVPGESSHSHNHNHNQNEEFMSRVESTCLLDNPRVYVGREFDEDRLVRLLVPFEGEKCSTQIISIVGLGGVGKTTLAKLAYNHPEVEAHFKMRVWVSVSDPFDPTKIAKSILEGLDNDKSANTTFNTSPTLNALVGRIKEIASQKKFLLVLDDVWTEDRSKWEPLKNCLTNGMGGSRILVTTRNEAVARMMGTSHWQPLGLLSDTDCSTILNGIALEGRSEEEQSKLRDIGMKIAEKCNGLPLAARTVGSMLALKFTEAEWQDVVESPLWKYEDDGLSDLFRILKLSYLDLNQTLKRCILSCIVLPQGYSVSLRELTNIWMAYGCISSNDNEDEAILKGFQYAQRLAMRSFFEKLNNEDQNDNIESIKYKIHDIVHDFITYMSGIEHTCVMMGPFLSQKVKRSPYLIAHHDNLPLNFLGKIRYCSAIGVSKEELPPNLIGLLKSIRLLIVCHCDLEDLTNDEVKNLIHLRYLDLSNNPIRELPTALTDLYNLQTLDFQGCDELVRLPQGIEKLRKLKHIIIRDTPSLREFPQGLRELTNLCTLSKFVVGEYGSKLGWLENLTQLRGSLSIEIVETDVEDAKKANLRNKNGIRDLELKFELRFGLDARMEEILEALQPPHGIETLTISSYGGKWFPRWMMDPAYLGKLKELNIEGFDDSNLSSLGQLASLERLVISGMRLKCLSTRDFLGVYSVVFPKLKELSFSKCGQWEEWEDIGDSYGSSILLPCLKELLFMGCPKLEGLPYNLLRRAKCLESLRILWDCDLLESRYDPNSGIDWDKISYIPHVEV